jgi:Tfp pilus assembly protein PilZ
MKAFQRGSDVSRPERILRVSFADADAFWKEYNANLVNAGVFIASDELFEQRETVKVDIVLEFCRESATLIGEVVNRVPVEMAGAGGTPGVAVQFYEGAQRVRELLEPLQRACGSYQPVPVDVGQRTSPRVPARVPARIVSLDDVIEGTTRNLSRSGALIEVDREVPVGDTVRLVLVHPETGDSMELRARVVRDIRTRGQVSAVGLRFEPTQKRRAEILTFIEEIQSSEHSRGLGGITGNISELGTHNLLQMFATTSRNGTLTLTRGEQVGVVGFEGGLLRSARLGTVSGMKALIRLVSWQHGDFEFHARASAEDSMDQPLPVDVAMLEAVRQLDELRRVDRSRFPGHAKVALRSDSTADPADLPTKAEAAVIDLARAGFSVERIVEVIPEPDPEIYHAFEVLVDQGVIAIVED